MLLNRYEVESCSDRVTHYGIRTVTGSAHKLSDRVTRVYTESRKKKKRSRVASSRELRFRFAIMIKKRLELSRMKKSSILTCLCRVSEHYSRPSNEARKYEMTSVEDH